MKRVWIETRPEEDISDYLEPNPLKGLSKYSDSLTELSRRMDNIRTILSTAKKARQKIYAAYYTGDGTFVLIGPDEVIDQVINLELGLDDGEADEEDITSEFHRI